MCGWIHTYIIDRRADRHKTPRVYEDGTTKRKDRLKRRKEMEKPLWKIPKMSTFFPRKVIAEAEHKCDEGEGTTSNISVVIHSESEFESAPSISSSVAKDNNSTQEAECPVPLS